MSNTEAPSNVSAPTQFLETKKEKYAAGDSNMGDSAVVVRPRI